MRGNHPALDNWQAPYGYLTAVSYTHLDVYKRQVLVIKVQYPHDILSHNMGKQIFWFSSAPGIWQSVWIEPRAKAHLTRIRLTPYLDFADGVCIHASVLAEVAAENAPDGIVALTLTAPESGRQYQADILLCTGEGKAELVIDVPELWEYRHGRLYEAVAELMIEGKGADCVRSHVGLRKVESRWLPGHSPEAVSYTHLDVYKRQ